MLGRKEYGAMVEQSRPQWDYTGAARQEWNRLHDQEVTARQALKSGGSSGASSGSASVSTGSSGGSSAGVSSGGGGGNVIGAVGAGIAGAVGGVIGASSALGEKSAGLSFWVVERFWPLKALTKLGGRIGAAGPKARLATAVPCALIGAGFALGQGGHDAVLGLLGLVIGAAIGWAVPTVLGFALAFGAMLVGLAIGLALIAAAVGLVYVAVTALAR